ncbi:MAG: hypothetical protein A2X49_09675 [Lentisphaerae bacterium GWF2_52_8]|nr:MAG: hypothetical protein A2X49_09675 [Lentisphaerae bacterium GWF2_52_8]
MSDGKDMTVREANIYALESSQDAFIKLKEAFKASSESFDLGNDAIGLQLIKDEIIPQLSNLYQFCYTLINVFDAVLSDDVREEMQSSFASLEALMRTLTDETEAGNFTEVGDILRFDLSDQINQLSVSFPKIAECFRKSPMKELDAH